MADFTYAINLIRKYEGFNEKAYANPVTGGEPYTFGYGTQFYPDGAPVKKGQCCSKEKALEYLFHEINVIDGQLSKLNIGLDDCMRQALLSFIHSVGWEAFLYSRVIDCIEHEDLYAATEEMGRWIFDEEHRAIGGLLDRRREEINLFLQEIGVAPSSLADILLTAFRNYTASPKQVKAIRRLEKQTSPYVLSEFANDFCIADTDWVDYPSDELDSLFNSWS
jgi:GH24 family phage-related lysozyme (muramidase)